MTKQIDELLAKYADHVFSDGLLGLKVPSAQSEACLNELRQALEAALKPGEHDAVAVHMAHCNPTPLYATPPAQTPPRLTDDEFTAIYTQWEESAGSSDGWTLERAIESAVRRQFGINED